MRSGILISVLAVVLITIPASADIITFFTPVDGGSSGFNNIWLLGFNDQTGTTLDTTDNTWIYNYSGVGTYTVTPTRYAWLDFGADYADVDITAIWTGYTRSSGTREVESWFQDGWWGESNDTTKDPGDVTATSMLSVFNSVTAPANANAIWVKQADVTITPQNRYLVLALENSSDNPWFQRVNEIIFEVPEPTTMGLLAVGGLALLRRRRK